VKPLLGIVLPVCNVESDLRRNVHYLLDTVPDMVSRFELMIVDDGSTDSTEEVAQELAREYPQIRVVRHAESLGPDAAVESALPLLESEVVYVHRQNEPFKATDLRKALRRSPGGFSTRLLKRLTLWGEALRREAASRLDSSSGSCIPAPASGSRPIVPRRAMP
jgi:glycosyltransferase involved in cell wall biosynthesis